MFFLAKNFEFLSRVAGWRDRPAWFVHDPEFVLIATFLGSW